MNKENTDMQKIEALIDDLLNAANGVVIEDGERKHGLYSREAEDEARAALLAAIESREAELTRALKGLSRMYTHAFDLVDGGLVMAGSSVQKFEDAHRAAWIALGEPVYDIEDENAAPSAPTDTRVSDELDAKRYRWLRDKWGYIEDHYDGERQDQMTDIYRAVDDHGWDVDPASLDAAIDAAMQSDKEQS